MRTINVGGKNLKIYRDTSDLMSGEEAKLRAVAELLKNFHEQGTLENAHRLFQSIQRLQFLGGNEKNLILSYYQELTNPGTSLQENKSKMTIEKLNKIIKEELDAFFEAEDEEIETPEADGDDDIEVTTDEPAEGDEALDTLRQIYDMLKPMVEPEEEEPEMDEEEPEEEEGEEEEGEEEEMEENFDRPNYKASDIQDASFNAEKLKGGLNESFDGAARFKKLANIKG